MQGSANNELTDHITIVSHCSCDDLSEESLVTCGKLILTSSHTDKQEQQQEQDLRLEDLENQFYSIKSIERGEDGEFEAVFEFDEESEEGGLSVSDIRLLEQLRQQQCIVLSEQESNQACAVQIVTQADVLLPPCTHTDFITHKHLFRPARTEMSCPVLCPSSRTRWRGSPGDWWGRSARKGMTQLLSGQQTILTNK